MKRLLHLQIPHRADKLRTVVDHSSSYSSIISSGHSRLFSTTSVVPEMPTSKGNMPQEMSSFITRAKSFGANALLGKLLTSPRFDRVLKGLEVTRVDVEKGEIDAVFEVTEQWSNVYNTCHGGAIATLVDVVGSMALLAKDPTRAGVSIELSVSYLSAAKAGEKVMCTAKALRVGKKLGFSSVELRLVSNNQLIATGKHTKAYA